VLSRSAVATQSAQVDAIFNPLNQQRVSVDSEMAQAMLADIEVYKAQMEGAKVEGEVQRVRVEGYRAQVGAYAETINADKTRFDAYESQMRGETAKVNLVESQARSYSAYVSGQAAKADINIKNQQAEIAVAELALRAWIAEVESSKVQLQAQSAAIQANVEGHNSNTQRFVAQAGAQTAVVELQIKTTEANMRNSIAIYDVEVRKYLADMEQLIRVASIQLEALKSVAQAASTLAAGAMAGISMGATVSADARIAASGSEQTSISLNPNNGQ